MCRHMGCFMCQAVLESQKTSVPGDLISIPGATEKISFILACLAFNLFFGGGGGGGGVKLLPCFAEPPIMTI